ncbi:uncharacterized protein LOC133841828 [Drosophila sulfurigaster albostrigata]|uniref:uncharacterized protein LOC133841828 n=1 Tax=Drosophila sulfurigaster albostrigata TaxID=89887 RepID=UPI002D21E6C0|nr:uncharacterized protein LOC133841828 [Drosophila sulfurigaster albostrigata]
MNLKHRHMKIPLWDELKTPTNDNNCPASNVHDVETPKTSRKRASELSQTGKYGKRSRLPEDQKYSNGWNLNLEETAPEFPEEPLQINDELDKAINDAIKDVIEPTEASSGWWEQFTEYLSKMDSPKSPKESEVIDQNIEETKGNFEENKFGESLKLDLNNEFEQILKSTSEQMDNKKDEYSTKKDTPRPSKQTDSIDEDVMKRNDTSSIQLKSSKDIDESKSGVSVNLDSIFGLPVANHKSEQKQKTIFERKPKDKEAQKPVIEDQPFEEDNEPMKEFLAAFTKFAPLQQRESQVPDNAEIEESNKDVDAESKLETGNSKNSSDSEDFLKNIDSSESAKESSCSGSESVTDSKSKKKARKRNATSPSGSSQGESNESKSEENSQDPFALVEALREMENKEKTGGKQKKSKKKRKSKRKWSNSSDSSSKGNNKRSRKHSDSDSDDILTSRKYKSKHKANVRNGLDFYEDDSVSEDDRFSSDGFGYNEKLNSDFSNANQLNEYEELYNKMYQIFEQVPSRYKYEMNTVLYPTLVVVYLRMIASGKFRRGKTFVESSMRSLDHSLMPRIDKLMTLQCSADLPKKARRLLAGEQQARVKVVLCEQSYELLISFKKSWASSKQTLFEQHFELIVKENNGVPYQQIGMGCAPLDKVYWATGEAVKEPPPPSPRAARRNRLKKTKLSPVKNQHMPIGNRLYTPMPRRWDLELQKDDEEHRVPLDKDNLPSIYIHDVREKTESVICATLSSKATMLAIGTQSGAVHVSSLTSTKLVKIKSAKSLEKLDTSTPGIDERMMDASSEKMIRKLYGHQGSVYSCAFEPHDHFLLTSSQDRTVRCWCLFTWSCVVIYPGHMAAIYSVCYAPQGYYIATASEDRTVRIWTQDSRKSLCVLVGHLAEVSNCKFHPNRHYLATGSADCTVRLWDIIKGVQVRLFTGHRDGITALAFSTCGRYLVTGSNDHYIVVWDIEKEHLVRALSYHTAGINSIVFAMDNKLFMVGGQDGELSIWNFEHLVQEYDSDEIRKLTNSKRKCSKLKSDDLLVISYPTKESPFYELHITPRNLLLATCIFKMESPDKESDMNKSTDDEELAMIKAYFTAQSNREKVVMKSTRDECGLDIFKSLMGYKIESPEDDSPETETVLDDVVDISLKKEFHLSNEKLCESLDIILDDFDDIVDDDKRSVVNVFNNEVCNSNADVVLEEKSKEQQQDVVIDEEESTRPDIIEIPSESQMNNEQFKGYSTDSSTESEDVSDIRSLESSDSNNLQTPNIITKNWVNKNRIEELRKRQEGNKRKRKLPLKTVRRGILSRGKNLQLLQDNVRISNQQVQNISQQNNTASNVLPPTKELKQSNLSEFDLYGTKNVNRNVRRQLLGYNDKPVGFNHGEKVNLINKDARNENNAVPKYEMDERKPVPHTIHETIDFKQPGIGNENKPLSKLNQKPNVENNCAGQNPTREYSAPQSVNYLRNQIAGNQYNTTQKFQMVPCNPRLDPNRKTIVGNIASGQNQTREHPGYAGKIVSVDKKAGNQGSMVLKHQMKPQNPGCSVNYLTNQRVGNENTMFPKHQMVPRTLAFNPQTSAGFKRQEIKCENKPPLKLNMANNCTGLNQTRGCPGNPLAVNQNRIISKYQMVPRNPFLDPNHETIADFKRQDNKFGNKPPSQVYMTNNCYGPNPIRQCPGNYLRNQMAENQNRMVPKFQMQPRLAPDPNRKTIADLKCQENRIGNKPTSKLNVENNSVNRNLYNYNILNIMESHDKSNTIIHSSNENGYNGNNMVTTSEHFSDNENTKVSDSGSTEYESSSDDVVEDISMKDSNSINVFLPQKVNSKQNRKVSDRKPGTNDEFDLSTQSESSDSSEVEEEAPKNSGPAFIPHNMSNERNKIVSAGITETSTHYSKDGESSNSSSEKKDVTDDPKELSMKDKEHAQKVKRTTGKSMHYSTDDHSSDSNSEEDESSDDTEELSIKNDEHKQKVYGGTGKLMFEDEASNGPKDLSIKDRDNNTKVYGRGKIMFEEEERVPDEYKILPSIHNNENKKVYAERTGKSMYNSKDDESSDSNLEEEDEVLDNPPIKDNEHNGNVYGKRTGKLMFEEEDKASDDPKEISIKDKDNNRKVYGRGKIMFEEEESVPDEYMKFTTINNNENKKVYARGTGKSMNNSTDDESSDSNLEEEEVSEDPPIKENEPNGNVFGRRTGKLMFEEDDKASDYTKKLPMKETEQNEKVYKRRTGKLMYEEEDKASDDPKELSIKDKDSNRKVYGRGKVMFEEEEEVPDEYKKLPTINNNENKKVYARGTGKSMHNSTDDESSDSNLEEEEVSEDPPIKENEPNGNVSGRRTGKLMFEEDDEASDHTKKLPMKETEPNEKVYKRRTGKLMYEEEDKASDDSKELSMKDKEHNRIVYGRGKIMFEEEERVPNEYKKLPTINNNENKKVYARGTGKSMHNSTDDESSDSNLEEEEVSEDPPIKENEPNGNVSGRRTGKLMFEEDDEASDHTKKLPMKATEQNETVYKRRTGKLMYEEEDKSSDDSKELSMKDKEHNRIVYGRGKIMFEEEERVPNEYKKLSTMNNNENKKVYARRTGKSIHNSTDDESSDSNLEEKDEVPDEPPKLPMTENEHNGNVYRRRTGKLMFEEEEIEDKENSDIHKKLSPINKKENLKVSAGRTGKFMHYSTDEESSDSNSDKDEASYDSKELYKNTNDHTEKGRKTGKSMHCSTDDESSEDEVTSDDDQDLSIKNNLQTGKVTARRTGKLMLEDKGEDACKKLPMTKKTDDECSHSYSGEDEASEDSDSSKGRKTGKFMRSKNLLEDESDLSSPSEFSDSSGEEKEKLNKKLSGRKSGKSLPPKSSSDEESDLSPPSEFSDSSGVEEEAPDVAGKLPLGGSEQNKTVSTGNTGKSMSPKNSTDDESDLSPPSEFSDSSGVEEEAPETVKSMSDDESEFSDSSEVEEEAPETVKSMSDDESDLSPPSEFSDTNSDDNEDASEMSTRVGSSSEDDSDDSNVVDKNRSNEDKELEKSISMDKNSRSIEAKENITSGLKQFENSSSNEASGENNIDDKPSDDGNNILHIEKQKDDFTKTKHLARQENNENITNVLTPLENSAYDEALDGGRTGIDANSSKDESSKNSDDGINIMKQPKLMEGVIKSSTIREYSENKTEEDSPGIGNSNVGDFKD